MSKDERTANYNRRAKGKAKADAKKKYGGKK